MPRQSGLALSSEWARIAEPVGIIPGGSNDASSASVDGSDRAMAMGAIFRARDRRAVHQSVHCAHRSVADRDGREERTVHQRPHASRTVRRRRGRDDATLAVRRFGKRNAAHAHAARAARFQTAGRRLHASSGATSAPGDAASPPRTSASAAPAASAACNARTSATRSGTASSADARSRAPAAHGADARRSAAWPRRRRADPGATAASSATARAPVVAGRPQLNPHRAGDRERADRLWSACRRRGRASPLAPREAEAAANGPRRARAPWAAIGVCRRERSPGARPARAAPRPGSRLPPERHGSSAPGDRRHTRARRRTPFVRGCAT
jgi:hypothetical protein